jgi:hypothetical protein
MKLPGGLTIPEAPLEAVVRYIAPCLAALMILLLNLHLLPEPPKPNFAREAKVVGLLFPAFYLTGVGPRRLLRTGGFIMHLLGISATRHRVALFGLAWLVLYIVAGLALDKWTGLPTFLQHVAFGFGHAALMSALGVFMFLAVVHDQGS